MQNTPKLKLDGLNSKWLKTALFFLSVLLWNSCANMVPPNGGKKDTTAPKLLKANPENKSVGFSSQKIKFSFDEGIQLKNPEREILISPELKTQPDYKVRKKELEIRLKDTLQKNCTYTINFGRALADVNESNVDSDFSYVFSTGAFLDSLLISGTVINAYTQQAETGCTVLLYPENCDSCVYKKSPLYYTNTKSEGKFILPNLKESVYNVVVLKESNHNKRYDGVSEYIGFHPKAVKLSKNETGLIIYDFKEKQQLKLLQKSFSKEGKCTLIFSSSLKKPELSMGEKKMIPYYESVETLDTINFWLPELPKDSSKIHITDQELHFDTLIRFSEEFKKKEKISLSFNFQNNLLAPGTEATISFAAPLLEMKTDSISITEDSVREVKAVFLFDKEKARKVIIQYPWKAESKYSIRIPANSFEDIYGGKNNAEKINFKLDDPENYGTLKLSVDAGKKGSYMAALIDQKGKVVRKDFFEDNIILYYKNLHPEKYRLRIIHDENQNKNWDTGNYLRKIQPEKISYYPKEINVRANWDLELQWVLPE